MTWSFLAPADGCGRRRGTSRGTTGEISRYPCAMPRAGIGHLERLPSGSCRVSVSSGIDPLTGRQLRHRRTAKTEEQARIVLGRLLEQASTGQRPGSDVKVAEVLTQYLAVAELEPSTRETYEGYIRRTIMPALGSIELRKVRGPVLDTFYARLRKCGDLTCNGRPFTEHRSFPALVVEPGDPRPGWQQLADTIKDAIGAGQLMPGELLPSVQELAARHEVPVGALRSALDILAGEGVIKVRQGRRSLVSGEPVRVPSRRSRPGDAGHDCARAGCRQHKCRPMSAATIRQIHSILSGAFATAVARDLELDLLALYLWLAAVTGARRGELCGLQWADIDLDAGVVHIAYSYLVRAGCKVRKDTKTHQGRHLAIDPVTVAVLAEQRRRIQALLASAGLQLAP